MSNTKTKTKPTPHPHAHWIKLWADGVPIEYKACGKWIKVIDFNTMTMPDIEYRIKPETEEPWKPKEGEKYFFLDVIDGEVCVNWYKWSDDETDNALYRNHNCFRTSKEAESAIPRVKKALKNLYTISDKKAHDLECELYDKIDRLTKYPELDGKPMTGGEKALIRAFRNGRLCRQFSNGSSLIVEGHNKVPCGVTTHREFVAFFMHSTMQDGEVRNALEQIKAEQENAIETIEAEQETKNEA